MFRRLAILHGDRRAGAGVAGSHNASESLSFAASDRGIVVGGCFQSGISMTVS